MPIVDFEQDPDMPLGTGNFRDDRGRVTYLSDPDTASRFIKTMPGSSFAKSVGSESTDLAKDAMGGAAPAPGTDLRTASNNLNDTGLPTPVGDVTAPVPGVPAAAPPAPAAPAAPPAPAGPGSAGVALVKKLDALPQKPAAAPPPAAAAAAPGLPVAQTTHSQQVVKGADKGNALRRIAEEETAGRALNAAGEQLGASKDARIDRSLSLQRDTVKSEGAKDFQVVADARAKQDEARRMEELKRKELEENDKLMDPDRYVRDMSGGKKVAMVILAALNGGFGALVGQKENGVMALLNDAIDRDIDRQKSEIASGRIRKQNEIDKYVKMGFDAETAEKMARDRMSNAIMLATKLEADRLGVQGENLENAKFLSQQGELQRAQRRGDILATTEDRATIGDTVTREVPKPVAAGAGLEAMLKQAELELKMNTIRNERIANANADELSAQIYGVDEKGNPKNRLNPAEAKELKDKVATVGPALAELAGAVNMTDELVNSLGGKLDVTTGRIEWPKDGDVKGAGPVDAAGGVLGVAGPVAPFVQGARALNLYRADIDKAREKQGALKEYVTSRMTGANSTIRQDATYGTMVGGDFTNEDQTKENIQAWANTLFAERNKHMARLGTNGMALMRVNESEAEKGAGAPPLKEKQ